MKSKEEILDEVAGWPYSKNQDVFVSTPHALKAMERYAIEKQIEVLEEVKIVPTGEYYYWINVKIELLTKLKSL